MKFEPELRTPAWIEADRAEWIRVIPRGEASAPRPVKLCAMGMLGESNWVRQ